MIQGLTTCQAYMTTYIKIERTCGKNAVLSWVKNTSKHLPIIIQALPIWWGFSVAVINPSPAAAFAHPGAFLSL